MSRVPSADSSNNRLDVEVIGNKADAVVYAVSLVASVIAYLKGLFALLLPVESSGEADIDISAADYTAALVALLTIAPVTALAHLKISLDLAKATTGYDAVSTGSDTITLVLQKKVDGTNWRGVSSVTKTAGSLSHTNGVEFDAGQVGPTEQVRVAVILNAERGDVEIPYRVSYRGQAPTITAVAAG